MTTIRGYLARYGYASNHPHLDDLRREFEQDRRLRALTPAVPGCPSWCTDTPGHGYDSVDDRDLPDPTFIRSHIDDKTSKVGAVTQMERACRGVVTLLPAELAVWDDDPNSPPLTAHAARARAEALLRLADRLDELSLPGRPVSALRAARHP